MNVVKKRPLAPEDDDEYKKHVHAQKKPKGDLVAGSPPYLGDARPAPITFDLEKLVNVEDLSGAPHHIIEQRFNAIAEAILCKHHLVVNSTSPPDGTKESAYEVLELEFYLWVEGSHRDPFTHGSEEQSICGQWYFHRAPQFSMDSHRNMTSQNMYRSGSRKGLDLTIGRPSVRGPDSTATTSRFFPTDGNPESTFTENDSTNTASLPDSMSTSSVSTSVSDIRGGILLRSLRRISDGKVICGPSLLVDEILQASNSDSIPDLVTSKWNDNINAFRSEGTALLRFRPRSCGSLKHESNTPQAVPQNTTQDQPKAQSSGPLPPTVYSSPRIGLDLSHPGTTLSRDHPRLLFVSKRYRYFTHPELLEKGRPQMFIGILHFCLRNGHTLRGTAGQSSGTIDSFFGKNGKSSRASGSSTGPNGKLRSEVMKIMNVKEATVEKYFTEYFAGLDKGVMKLYIGAAGKGASTSPATYLRMIGTLERFLDNVPSS